MEPRNAVPPHRFVTEGDSCVIVSFGSELDPLVNRVVHAFARRLIAEALPGVLDVVPAFTTVAIHYRPEMLGDGGSAAHATMCERAEAVLARGLALDEQDSREIEIPVCYGIEFGPDLQEVASACGLSAAQVIERHVASMHTVGMLGFAPGFPYISGLDPALTMPRRATPRTKIPAGSVAIAGRQSAIYPLETPGGWNLIGRTPLNLFDLARDPPCLLQPGDRVRFVPVDHAEYLLMDGTAP